MRFKNILSIIAFVAAFGISVTLAALTADNSQSQFQFVRLQSNDSTRQNITRFLQQDIRNGHKQNPVVYRDGIYSFENRLSPSTPYIVKRAMAVSDYVAASSAMDESNLPQDFQIAWLKHMRAWHNYADFLQQAKSQKMGYTEIKQLERRYNREINSTWDEVLRVGARYGAFVDED